MAAAPHLAASPLASDEWTGRGRAPAGAARVALVVAGLLALVAASCLAAYVLYSSAAHRRLDRELTESVQRVQAATLLRNGRVVTAWIDDRETLRAYSGVYWQVATAAPAPPAEPLGLTPLATSRSLWDATLPPPAVADLRAARPGQTVFYDAPGPVGQRLRVAFVRGEAADGAPAVYLAARDTTGLQREAAGFAARTMGGAGALGLAAGALFLRRRRA